MRKGKQNQSTLQRAHRQQPVATAQMYRNWNQDETLGPRRTRKRIMQGTKKKENA